MIKSELRGKWALVTGASRGIGRQITLGLAGYGVNLVLHSRNLEHTSALAAEVESLGVQVHQTAADLSDRSQTDVMLADVQSVVPGIDILYNNAAIMAPYRSEWLTVTADDIRLSFEVNVIAPILICNAILPGMIERKWGRIVNVTSGVKEQPELTAYAVSKAALDKYVLDTAARLAKDGVLMNLLDPGWLRTDLGGPNAPGSVESVLPGALVPVLMADNTSGVLFRAQDYFGQII
jgi:3-oxoacyl-[acyl-carrier protein] reductase